MVMNRIIAISICCLCFISCLEEEPILPVEKLYGEEIVEEFSFFDPCDTVNAPNYMVDRITNPSTEIDRLFHLRLPLGEVLYIGRSAADNPSFDKSKLFYHGQTIMDNKLGEPVFVLFEDETGIPGFQHMFLIGKASSFDSRYIFGASSCLLYTSPSPRDS